MQRTLRPTLLLKTIGSRSNQEETDAVVTVIKRLQYVNVIVGTSKMLTYASKEKKYIIFDLEQKAIFISRHKLKAIQYFVALETPSMILNKYGISKRVRTTTAPPDFELEIDVDESFLED